MSARRGPPLCTRLCLTSSASVFSSPHSQEDLDTLLQSGLFQNVEANAQPTEKGVIVEFVFLEKVCVAQ